RRKHHRHTPADQDNKKAMSIWEREDARLAKTIEDLENKIKQADRDRARRKTVLQQLDAAEAGRARIRKFREEVARARRDGKRIVFSLLGAGDGAVFCKYLDRAFSTGVGRISHPSSSGRMGNPSHNARQGVQWLREAAFLLTPAAAQNLRDNRV